MKLLEYNVLHPVTSCLLGQLILNISDIPNLRSSLSVRDQVSQPYKNCYWWIVKIKWEDNVLRLTV
jgi:hypothetical protein